MGSVVPQKNTNRMETIEAREIVLSDGETSAKLTPQSLSFRAGSGREVERATIAASEFSLGGRYATVIRPEGIVCSREGMPRFDLAVREIGASIAFKNADGHMGSMLDESTMVLMDETSMVSMRPEHIFLQKGEADTLLTSSALKIRNEARQKAIAGQANPGEFAVKKPPARAGIR